MEGSAIMNNMREYLVRVAGEISRRSCADLPPSARDWRRRRPARVVDFLDMMGLSDLPPRAQRAPVPVTVTGKLERDQYTIEKLHYQARPGFYLTANLYVPHGLAGPAPGVLYVCGHSRTPKVHYQFHPRRFAQLGFVCLIVDTIQFGELPGHHHGLYHEGWFHWYSRGYHSGGAELLAAIRGLDLLQERPEVDGRHLGVTGISGGGSTSFWLGAADERVGACAPVCGGGTVESHIRQRTIDGHCDCMHPVTALGWDMADVGALIAPRPLLICQADHDGIYSIESVRELYAKVKRVYDLLGASEGVKLIETPGPHSYHETSRTGIFSWFLKHLAGKNVPPGKVGDIEPDESRKEPFEVLRVLTGGPPSDARSAGIQDHLVKLAQPPTIRTVPALKAHRKRVLEYLRSKTFGQLPQEPCGLDVRERLKIGYDVRNLEFTSEEGWRLPLRLQVNPEAGGKAPCLLHVVGRGEIHFWGTDLMGSLSRSWAKVTLEPRGVGETAWGEELSLHLRRAAAWTGRTIASMQVYDLLRGLELVRSMPGVDPSRVGVAARGAMCAVALYAALLDGKVDSVVLCDPPATQDSGSNRDGTGPAIEMLQCLRVTDLPQVAGLLWPTELVFVHDRPDSYGWAEELYDRLGTPGKVVYLASLGEWQA